MRWLILLFSSLFLMTAVSAQEKPAPPSLVLEPGGHTAGIFGLAFTPDGQELISAGLDHTIRFWDVHTGEMLRVLRLPIYGDPEAGKLALSADGRLLAVSVAGPPGEHWIALLALPEGRLLRYLRGHSAPVWCLALSPDGQWLASGSQDGTARLWDLKAGRCDAILQGQRGSITGVAFSPDSRHLATSSYDETARIWAVKTGQTVTILRDQEERSFSMSGIAWSPDGQTLATGSLGTALRVWGPDGTLRRRFPGRFTARSLRFTADSQGLVYAGPQGGCLIDLRSGEVKTEFPLPMSELTWSTALSPGEKLVAIGGQSGDALAIWNAADGRRLLHLAGPGRATWGAGWSSDGQRIGWGVTPRDSHPRRPGYLTLAHRLERSFSWTDLEFGPVPDDTFQGCQSTWKNLSVDHYPTQGWVIVNEGGEQICMVKAAWTRCCSFLPGGQLLTGGYRGIGLYDPRSGEQLRQLTGHAGLVHALAPSPDGRHVLSSAGDQTLRIWKLDRSSPLLSLFFAGNEWIAWTPEGYYACSPGGERLMGWLVNNGPERLATFHPAARFRASLYRPDVIRRLLPAGNLAQALAEADRALGKTTPLTQVAEVLPPLVLLTAPDRPQVTIQEETLQVRFVVQPVGQHPIKAVRLLVNGRPHPAPEFSHIFEPPRQQLFRGTCTLQLGPGKHLIAIQAESAVSKALSDPVEVTCLKRGVKLLDPAPDLRQRLPSLYVLAIGISDYPGKWKLGYAAHDAEVLSRTIQQGSQPLFRQVEIKLLTNQQATRRGILQGLAWLRKQMTQNDVGIFFFAGHGSKDSDEAFYLMPVDGDPADLLSTAVPGDQLKKVLAGMPGKFIVLLDACHAGAVNGVRRSTTPLTDDLVRDLATDDYGVIVMCSAMGREYALESAEVQHGHFSLALIEGLSGRADYNQDRLIHLNELDLYVTDRVKQLSQGQQHPVTARPTSIRSFPLARH